jgi:hypothetical protein
MINTIFRIFQNQRIKDLYRYSKETNTCYIDVEIDFYRELYNEWDFSPITNRDLDEELFEFLESSVEDISRKYNVCICFNIPENLKDTEKEEKSIQGFKNYFNYEIRKQNNLIRKEANKAITSGIYGMIFLFSGSWATAFLETHEMLSAFSFLAEGLIIGGWVFGWELISIIFYKSEVLFEERYNLERLRDAKIEFNYRPSQSSQ